MSKREPKLYLQDILDSIKKIEDYLMGLTIEKFENDQKTIDAVIRNIEVLGEAAKNVPGDLKIKYPNIPWGKMVSMRNKVLHEYFGIDIEILWQTIQEDLPKLKQQIGDINHTFFE